MTPGEFVAAVAHQVCHLRLFAGLHLHLHGAGGLWAGEQAAHPFEDLQFDTVRVDLDQIRASD